MNELQPLEQQFQSLEEAQARYVQLWEEHATEIELLVQWRRELKLKAGSDCDKMLAYVIQQNAGRPEVLAKIHADAIHDTNEFFRIHSILAADAMVRKLGKIDKPFIPQTIAQTQKNKRDLEQRKSIGGTYCLPLLPNMLPEWYFVAQPSHERFRKQYGEDIQLARWKVVEYSKNCILQVRSILQKLATPDKAQVENFLYQVQSAIDAEEILLQQTQRDDKELDIQENNQKYTISRILGIIAQYPFAPPITRYLLEHPLIEK